MFLKTFSKMFIALLILSVASVYAKYDLNSTAAIPLNKDVKTGVLPNGLKYFILKNKMPQEHGHFRIVLRAGAINEDDDQNGLAHFTEHMCFNGTKNYPKNKLLDVLQKSGVRFGADVNASTSYDVTLYELPIPLKDEKLVKEAFQILADWAGAVTMNEDDINEEREVIVSEWRQRMSVQGRLREKHMPTQWWGSKYAERNVIGDTGFLRTFKPEQIRRFYNDWYRPNLMAFIAVGDFDVNNVEKMIKQYFSGLTNPKNERKREIFELPYHEDTKVSIESDKEMSNENATFITKLPKYDENTYAGYARSIKDQLFSLMLGLRLMEISNAPNPPFLRASGGMTGYLGERNAFYGDVRAKDGKIREAMQAFVAEVARVQQHGFNQSELDMAVTQYRAMIEDAKAKSNTTQHFMYVSELTDYFTDGSSAAGIDFDYDFTMQVLDAVKLDEFQAMSKDYLTVKNTTITISTSTKPEASKLDPADVANLMKTTMIAKIDSKEEKVITEPFFSKEITKPGRIVKEEKNAKLGIETLELSNGAKVILKKTDFKENEVLFSAHSWGGSSLYSDKEYISAELAPNMVNESGLSKFSKIDLDKVNTGKIASAFAYVSDYSEGFSGQASTKDLETLFQMIHLYATDLRMDKAAYDSWVEKVIPSLKSKGTTQDDIFRDSVSFILSNHHYRTRPFTLSILGEANYNRGMEIFKERFSNAGDFTFYLVGDFDPATVKAYFAKYIGSIPAGNKEKYKDLNFSYPSKASKTIIKKGTDDKAHIRLTIPGNFESTPKNRYVLSAMSDAIEIRLIETIREKLGAVYSPGVWVETHKEPKGRYAFNIDIIVAPKTVDQVVKEIVKVIDAFKAKPDEEAADKVRKADLNGREVNLKTNGYWISSLASRMNNNEPLEGILEVDNTIKSTTAKELQAAAKKYLDTKKMIQIIAMPE